MDGITFAPGASSFTITASAALRLTLGGAGVTNDSGTTQNFVAAPSQPGANGLRLLLKNNATAGSGTFFTTTGGTTIDRVPGSIAFSDTSSAGNGTFNNHGPTAIATFGPGETGFGDNSTASDGTFINNGATTSATSGGLTDFGGTSTAANAVFTNKGATASNARGGITAFGDDSTAGNATITNQGGTVSGASGGVTRFEGVVVGTSTAGNATIINDGAGVSGASGGVTDFAGVFQGPVNANSTAGSATIISNGSNISGATGGKTIFETELPPSQGRGISTAASATLIANGGTNGGQGGSILFTGGSIGGTSRVEVFGNGFLDISSHSAPGVTVGSIEGNGNVFLGANNIAVGSNNKDTTFSGVIQDGGLNGGVDGSLTKIGTGTLDLTGANTYTGNTNVNSGVLEIDGSIMSDTFVSHGGTLAGTGMLNGIVTNGLLIGGLIGSGTVSPGDASGTLGTLTVNNYTQQLTGTLLIDIAGASTGQYSVLNVLGTANLRGLLDPVLLNGFVPTIGESFTFLDYGAVTGSLFIFDRNIDGVAEHWDVTYQSNEAILTVELGNVPVPDHGSTLLLLTLSVLGLVTYQQHLLRKQARALCIGPKT